MPDGGVIVVVVVFFRVRGIVKGAAWDRAYDTRGGASRSGDGITLAAFSSREEIVLVQEGSSRVGAAFVVLFPEGMEVLARVVEAGADASEAHSSDKGGAGSASSDPVHSAQDELHGSRGRRGSDWLGDEEGSDEGHALEHCEEACFGFLEEGQESQELGEVVVVAKDRSDDLAGQVVLRETKRTRSASWSKARVRVTRMFRQSVRGTYDTAREVLFEPKVKLSEKHLGRVSWCLKVGETSEEVWED